MQRWISTLLETCYHHPHPVPALSQPSVPASSTTAFLA